MAEWLASRSSDRKDAVAMRAVGFFFGVSQGRSGLLALRHTQDRRFGGNLRCPIIPQTGGYLEFFSMGPTCPSLTDSLVLAMPST